MLDVCKQDVPAEYLMSNLHASFQHDSMYCQQHELVWVMCGFRAAVKHSLQQVWEAGFGFWQMFVLRSQRKDCVSESWSFLQSCCKVALHCCIIAAAHLCRMLHSDIRTVVHSR